MPLKKPSELFDDVKFKTSKATSPNADEDFSRIKEELSKVDTLRTQLDTVASSLNGTLTEVIDKNFKSIDDYSEILEGFNKKIDSFQKEIIYKVDEIEKSNQVLEGRVHGALNEYVESNIVLQDNVSKELSNVKSEVTVFEKHQNKLLEVVDTHTQELSDVKSNVKDNIQELSNVKSDVDILPSAFVDSQVTNLKKVKDEVLSEVKDILSGDVSDNIKRLEEKIEYVRDTYKSIDITKQPEPLQEGLLNIPPWVDNSDPLTPLDKKYATLQDLQNSYRLFINRVQIQLSTLGGGGENNNDGWEYVSDKALEVTPIALTADTWTKITNDGSSSSTNRQMLPKDSGISRIYDLSDDTIRLNQVPVDGHLIFRIGVKFIPNVNNTTVKTRIAWTTQSGFTFYLESADALLNDGAGIEYEKQFVLPFYVGNENSQQGSGIIEVRADATASVTDCAFFTIVG